MIRRKKRKGKGKRKKKGIEMKRDEWRRGEPTRESVTFCTL